MIYYLDTSVALQAVLGGPERDRLIAWLTNRTLISSRLFRTELIRGLRRENKPLSDGYWLFDRVGLIDITRQTHLRAEAIERHVKTLDALHLATALGLNFPITIATHDENMRQSAEALGFATVDPVSQRD